MKLWLLIWHAIPIGAYVISGEPKYVVWWFLLQTVATLVFVAFAKEAVVSAKRVD